MTIETLLDPNAPANVFEQLKENIVELHRWSYDRSTIKDTFNDAIGALDVIKEEYIRTRQTLAEREVTCTTLQKAANASAEQVARWSQMHESAQQTNEVLLKRLKIAVEALQNIAETSSSSRIKRVAREALATVEGK